MSKEYPNQNLLEKMDFHGQKEKVIRVTDRA
jgi:hypothetical protein